MCPFNLWNKSRSSELMSGLYGAWDNTSHSHLLSNSVGHNLPLVRVCVVMQYEWPIPEQVRSVFVHFSAQFLQPVMIIHCCHTCPIRIPTLKFVWLELGSTDLNYSNQSDYNFPKIQISAYGVFLKLNIRANHIREYKGLKVWTKPREKSVIDFGFGVGMTQT
jgi:hypothetical protein